jgi:hypothetical protein
MSFCRDVQASDRSLWYYVLCLLRFLAARHRKQASPSPKQRTGFFRQNILRRRLGTAV